MMINLKLGKYHRGKHVEGQFGEVERETGICFLVPVENRTANTLMALIEEDSAWFYYNVWLLEKL